MIDSRPTRASGAMRSFARPIVLLRFDYLRLCEDELEIRKLGLVTNRTWAVWSDAIEAGIATPLSRELIDERPAELHYVRQFASDHVDPYKGWKLWAKWNGL